MIGLRHPLRAVLGPALVVSALWALPVLAQPPIDATLEVTDAWLAGNDIALFVEWTPGSGSGSGSPGGGLPGGLGVELADGQGTNFLEFTISAASQIVVLPGGADPRPGDPGPGPGPGSGSKIREFAVTGGPYGQYFAHMDLEITLDGQVKKKKPVSGKDKNKKKYCYLELIYVECIIPEEDANLVDDGDELYVKLNGRTIWTLPSGDIDRNETASINFGCLMCEKPNGPTNFALVELWDSDPPDDILGHVPFTACEETGAAWVNEIRQGTWHYRLHWKITCYKNPVPGRGAC